MRFISKTFAEWIWYYFLNNKTQYFIHIGLDNHRIGGVVDNLLIKMKRLKVIDLFTFNSLDFWSLTDVGLCELGRLSMEELRLSAATCVSGSFIVEWIMNASPLLESLKVLTLTNLKTEYFHLLKEFKNLKTLELMRLVSERKLHEEEMDQTVIGFPQSLTEFRSNYPLTRKNIEDITQQCPNLTVLVINPSYFDDSILSLVLSNVSQKIEKFSLFARDTLSNITGSFFSVFSSNSFSHLKKLKVAWKSTSDETILNLQKNLGLLSRTLERLNVVFTNEYDPSYELDTLLGCLCNLSKLSKLTLQFPRNFQFTILKEDILEQLKSCLQLRILKIYGGTNEIICFNVVKALIGQHLEKLLYHTDTYIDIEEEPFFFHDCEDLKILDLQGEQFEDKIIHQNIQAIVNCKLEEVLVMSNEFFKSSKKTLELIAEKKAKIDTEFTETEIEPILKPIGEDLYQFVQENIPPQKKDYTIHIADVKVPKTGPFNTSYYSEPFIQFGHEWVVDLLPDDDDFLKFKFVVGMKKVEEEPFKPFNNIEMFHVGRKELSSTNYPPIVHRWAAEFPLSIHTLTFRVSPDNIDRCCYSDKFTAFGAKFSACFDHLGVAKKKTINSFKKCFQEHADNPENLFRKVEMFIHESLKLNYFHGFLKSDLFHNYLIKSGKTIDILHEIGTLKEGIEYMAVESMADLKNQNFSLGDFAFLKRKVFCGETINNREWILAVNQKQYKCYFTKDKYDFGNSVGLKFFKFEILFPYNVKQVLKTFTNQEYRQKIDEYIYDIQTVKYVEEPHIQTKDKLFTSVINHEKYKLIWPIKDREIIVCTSSVHDRVSNLYIIGFKSCDSLCLEENPEHQLHNEKQEKSKKKIIKACVVGGWFFESLSENETKFHEIYYIDMKGSIPKLMMDKVITNRASKFYKLGLKYLKENERNGFPIPQRDAYLYQLFKKNGDIYLR
ncbi:predicted protein [Naegleria gruberi]|uniref:Predicted protein n=1 Tax=Naegleria gruberi TaxID=5762 RepID=D2W1C0_NAEGR|nr:uncharacterized protein NAEGRDRAFT_53933 [Naegleria gruberi]EFC37200.1 predicted protein [Naegleria gruberi]|eukprot:XP_002669944.1 predicted protein [Naegleria gruberi strain NEG-M]